MLLTCLSRLRRTTRMCTSWARSQTFSTPSSEPTMKPSCLSLRKSCHSSSRCWWVASLAPALWSYCQFRRTVALTMLCSGALDFFVPCVQGVATPVLLKAVIKGPPWREATCRVGWFWWNRAIHVSVGLTPEQARTTDLLPPHLFDV